MFSLIVNSKFRLLFINSIFGDFGSIAFFMAQGWLALLITGSPFWVGAAAGCQGLGLMIFATIGGVLADRFERRNLVIVGQIMEAVLALGVGVLVLTDTVALWSLMLMGFLHGVSGAIRTPARNALVYDLVGKEQLLKGTAANYLVYSVVGIIGPLITGPVLDNSLGWAYLFVATAVLIGAGVLSFLRYQAQTPGQHQEPANRTSPWRDFVQGLSFGFKTPSIRVLVVLALAVEIFAWPHESMLPVMANNVFHVGGTGYGYILAAAGAGAIVFTTAISRLGGSLPKAKLMLVSSAAFGLFLVLFGYSPLFGLSLLFIAIAVGMGFAYETLMSTLLQTAGPGNMRGRILSFQAAIWGLSAVAGFYIGAIANLAGARGAIAIGGGILVVVTLLVFPMIARLGETRNQ